MKSISLFVILVLFFTQSMFAIAFAQTTPQKREYIAVRSSSSPKIDGDLNDSCWLKAIVAGDFTQSEPNPGLPSRMSTEVRLLYDDKAIYVAAMMFDPHPDSIQCELSKRDNVFFGPNADAFGVLIDAYHDGQNAVLFGVSDCGVQTDTRISNPDNFDDTWNVVWESKIKITDKGWQAEMRIPYSALRFPRKEIQEWGVNFTREIKRYKEFSNWNFIDYKIEGIINQSGVLLGVSNIESPLRLSFTPYISTYVNNYAGGNAYLFNGGADIKYGINESFTLDATLIPDFGQAKSDNKILNLSPFEVQYDEQRSFFMEGTDLFNKGDVFYSRRVGGLPIGYEDDYSQADSNEVVEENPVTSQLFNAIKISGRTKNKLGIGLFNALTAPAYATLRDTITQASRNFMTQPLANYNVLVLDQVLKNNSFVSLVNTNVTRDGNAYDANVSALQFKFCNKKNLYSVWGTGAVSKLSSQPFTGQQYEISAGKVSGNYTANLTERFISKEYDPNDLGYNSRTNEFDHFLNQSYNIFKPFWKINKMTNDLGIDYFMRNDPRTYAKLHVDWNTNIDFKNYYSWGFVLISEPVDIRDYFEPRVDGRYYVRAPFYGIGTFFSTDSRKRFTLEGNIGRGQIMERDRVNWDIAISPRYRFSDKFNLSYSYHPFNQRNEVGWVDNVNDTIIFGVRDVSTIENYVEGNYLFTNKMSLSLFLRHYWSQVKYSEYFALNDNGKSATTTYNSNNDINFNAFNVDLAFTWQFLPGSEMSIVWKNAILTEDSELVKKYYDNLHRTIGSPQSNSISLKILYYLDYQKLRRGK